MTVRAAYILRYKSARILPDFFFWCRGIRSAARQHVHYGLTIDEALAATRNPWSARTIYRRAEEERRAVSDRAKEATSKYLSEHGPPPSINLTSSESATSTLSPSPAKAMRRSVREALGAAAASSNKRIEDLIEKGVQDGVSSFGSSTTHLRQNLDTSGVEPSAELTEMQRKLRSRTAPRKTSHQANYDEFANKVAKMSARERYSAALKEATQLVVSGEMGAGKAARQTNKKFNLTSKLVRKLSKSTVLNYCNKGLAGSSPMKRGPARKLPPEFHPLVQAHCEMKQLEGIAEAKPKHIKAIIGAALMETPYADMSRRHLYQQFRKDQADSMGPTKPMQVEERRGIWTTYNNLSDWFDGAKRTMIEYGFAEDKPQRVIDIFKGREDEIPEGIDSEFCFIFNCPTTEHRR